ncbi:MAG: hypothetical protein IJ637_07875, partial [Prevotella sp.]|nr:hypothetical protein [Prevotella sp.]
MLKQLLIHTTMLLALLAVGAASHAADTDVTATLTAGRAATIDNGIVKLSIASDGSVNQCTYGGQSLIPSGSRFYFSCNQPDYSELVAD